MFFLIIFIFLLTIFSVLNIKTTRLIGINFKVTEYQIPIYLKILEFFDRHYNYKYLVKNINQNINKDDTKNIVINLTKWIKINIKKIPKTIDIIDNHPLTIVHRRLGTEDQFSDLLSVLLVYSNVDSFYKKFHTNKHPLTFFKINDYWSIIDPYYGIIFLNNDNFFASIKDLKENKWKINSLKFEEINDSNMNEFFENKFNNYYEVIEYYKTIFSQLPSSSNINNTNIFNRGGRSYTQKPFSRLTYEIHNFYNNL